MKCNICGSINVEGFSKKKWIINDLSFSNNHCIDCDTVFSNPIPDSETLKNYYEQNFDYSFYKKLEPLKKLQAKFRINRIKNYLHLDKNKKWLDVGCGHGYFIEKLLKQSINAYGIDFAGEATAYAKKRNLNIIEGDLALLDNNNAGKFDYISMWHSLEHVPDPKMSISKIGSLLNPGGKLIIAVPNIKSMGFKRRLEKWIWFQDPVIHIYHYSPKSLSILVNECGFKIDSISTSDTWDAQYFYDGIAKYKMDTLFGFLKIHYPKPYFYFSEISRLIAFPISIISNKTSKDLIKSELLIICTKN